MGDLGGTSFVDGVIATMNNQQRVDNPSPRGQKGMSEVQKSHILKVRRMVESTHDMRAYDWRNILFRSSSSTADKYYVKASAAWIPHLIKRGFHPYCPCCEKPVPSIDYRWVDQPMIMFGLTGHRYLDTVRYKCVGCRGTFRATNAHSLSLDKTGFVSSTFQVHLLKRCAVDKELYNFVTSSMMLPTSTIVKSLQDQTMKEYVGHVIQHYQVSLQKKAATEGLGTRQNGSGSIVEAFAQSRNATNAVSHRPRNPALTKKQRELRESKLNLQRLNLRIQASIPLKSIRGLGVSKIKQMIAIGVGSGQDLVLVYEQMLAGRRQRYSELCGLFNKKKAVEIVKRYVEKVQLRMSEQETEKQNLDDKIKALQSEIQQIESEMGSEVATPTVRTDAAATEETFKPDAFSTFEDRKGYNGRFFSAYYVEHVQNLYFEAQKPGMKTRVVGLGGEVLSMDFEYKTACRVKVYVDGKPFSPWKCMASVLNEDAMCIWWGFLTGSESLTEIEPHLLALKGRLDKLQGPDHHIR